MEWIFAGPTAKKKHQTKSCSGDVYACKKQIQRNFHTPFHECSGIGTNVAVGSKACGYHSCNPHCHCNCISPCEKIFPEIGGKPKQGTGAWRTGSAVMLGTWAISDDLGWSRICIPHHPTQVSAASDPAKNTSFIWKYHQAYGLTWTWTRNHLLTGVQPGLTHLRSEEISEMMFFEWTFLAGEKATML